MKKAGIFLSLILLIISLISISYASFLVEGNRNFIANINDVEINISSIKENKYELFDITYISSLTYDSNTNEIIKEDAKIIITLNLSQQITSYFPNRYFYITLNVNGNNELLNLKPIIYLTNSSNSLISYFTIKNSSTNYEAYMPIMQKSIFSNNYLSYIMRTTYTNLRLVFDFSSCLLENAKLSNTNQFNLTLDVKEVI